MPSAIDWERVYVEALDVLVRYIRIDTSNPPGNEAAAARLLGELIEAEDVECAYLETAPGREIVYARLPGDGGGRPLMLANHRDVVPVEAEQWTVPAFEGVVRDGRIYGRGAVDMKGAAVMQLMAFLLVRRQRLELERDLVFCAVPDEEVGSRFGMEWLCERHPELVDVEYAINEGGAGQPDFGGREARLFHVATNEKEMSPLRLTAVGTPGHGSRPHDDNSAVRLMRALVRLASWDRGITFTPETRDYVERLQRGGLVDSVEDTGALEAAIKTSPDTLAAFVNTLNVTMVNAGIKSNVIPAKSEAIIDCRLLPGQSRRAWRDEVEAYIDDPAIEVAFMSGLDPAGAPPMVASQWDTELYRTIESVVTGAMEDAVVAPAVSIVGTDNRFLRRAGVTAYGFIPCLLSPEERAGFHANDEFLTVDNLNMGCELMYEIVRRMCT